jgi:hypothetical protein
MVGLIFLLCALTALLCSGLLYKAFRNSGYKLLLWGSVCFAGLTLNHVLLIIDRFVVTFIDLSPWRLTITLLSLIVFLYGLIWDSE